MQRGGFPFRIIILALFVVGTVYLLYLYNGTLGRLRDAELSAERYRREEETKVAQLTEVMRSKDELQEKCDNEKHEFTNRLNSLNQQHKMLKSQYDEHEVEQMRLEQEAKRLREEFQQVESQRNQEYQELKQQKELEISSLKDQVADAVRQKEQVQIQVTNLQAQIQNGQQQLVGKNQLLQQQQQQQQQQVAAGQNAGVNAFQQPQQNLNFDANAQPQLGQQQQQQFQQQPVPGGVGQQQGGVANMNIGNAGDNNVGAQAGGINAGVQQDFNDLQNKQQDVNNEHHQMMPPVNNPQQPGGVIPDAPVNENADGHQGQPVAEVKNEDHQVMPPDLNGNAHAAFQDDLNKDAAGGGVGAGANEVEHGDQGHEDPLDLKQMAPPDLGHAADNHQAKDDIMQQQPPVQRAPVGNAGEEEEEEEEEQEEDQYQDDKYEDNNNNNVRINPGRHGDDDYH
ncbi:Golgi integral membrane protein 4-like isoform X2 [Littorina saxatilis]|uniref:Golgi integral membrane protein 4-like isoform X2 n=1 Tax=Littorina saxatilis TaxID=31220 RepID=UPI0038B61DD4